MGPYTARLCLATTRWVQIQAVLGPDTVRWGQIQGRGRGLDPCMWSSICNDSGEAQRPRKGLYVAIGARYSEGRTDTTKLGKIQKMW